MRMQIKERVPLVPSSTNGFLMISIHHFKSPQVNDRYVLFTWEYRQDTLEAIPCMPILRRRELAAARAFCEKHGMIPVPTTEADPISTVEYWVQKDAPRIIEAWNSAT